MTGMKAVCPLAMMRALTAILAICTLTLAVSPSAVGSSSQSPTYDGTAMYDDIHYPSEEVTETSALSATLPVVTAVTYAPSGCSAMLRAPDGRTDAFLEGDVAFGVWHVVAVMPPCADAKSSVGASVGEPEPLTAQSTHAHHFDVRGKTRRVAEGVSLQETTPMCNVVAIEAKQRRWAMLVFLTVGSTSSVTMRKPVGELSGIEQVCQCVCVCVCVCVTSVHIT